MNLDVLKLFLHHKLQHWFRVVRHEGVAALYGGIIPGLQRQMAFSAIRIGLYDDVKMVYMKKCGVTNTHGLEMMCVRVMAGVTTATLAILLAQPTDVVKVRMQAGARSGQYRYHCFFTAGESF